MSTRDIARFTEAPYIEDMRVERRAVFGTTTLLIVSGLAHPDYLVEIDAIAAKPTPENG